MSQIKCMRAIMNAEGSVARGFSWLLMLAVTGHSGDSALPPEKGSAGVDLC